MSEAWKKRDRPCPPCGTVYEAFWGNGGWARTDKLTGKTHHESDCVRILKAKLAHKGTL